MINLLTRKLELSGPLPEDDKRFLDSIIKGPREFPAHRDIIREGDSSVEIRLVLQGFACRLKHLPNGARQIMAYLIPGDLCDLHAFILRAMDHSISTLSACQIVFISRARVLEMTQRPAIARALWWATLVDEATLREWLVNIGQRDAEQRLAHLICEIHLRLKSIGLADGGAFDLPLTQVELADTMGISPVHANRVLQNLRAKNLISFKQGELVILDVERLRELSGFNPNYLHLEAGKKDSSNQGQG